MPALLLCATLLLAFVNGANDNFKGVATLYGSGALAYRAALTLAAGSTALSAIQRFLSFVEDLVDNVIAKHVV